jgi:hypothetical protein|tara:strand:- start:894 stop:1208 length:315 start_codon:yes stop_codon:yes gene_type:complete
MKMPNDIYQTMLEETAEIRDGKVWYSLKSANLAYATMLPEEPFVMVRRKSETTTCGFTFVIMPVVHMDSYFTERPTRMENIDEITFDSLVNLKALHHKTIGVNK